jgi:hypothetical protein
MPLQVVPLAAGDRGENRPSVVMYATWKEFALLAVKPLAAVISHTFVVSDAAGVPHPFTYTA